MILKHATWDAQLCGLGRLSASEQRELDHLRSLTQPEAIAGQLPVVPADLVERCLEALCAPPDARTRARLARELEVALEPFARRSRRLDVALRVARRATRLSARAARRPARKRLVAGGALIAVTGDGPAVTGLAREVFGWLEPVFPVRAFTGSDDEASALRHTANGGISICEGWPTRLQDAVDVLVVAGPPGPGGPTPDVEVAAGRPSEDALAEVRRAVWNRL